MIKDYSKNRTIFLLTAFLVYFIFLLFATSPSSTNAAGGFTCDTAQDFGNTCIDTTGKSRCKTPYSEQCGAGCSRQITCGGSGEFKAGECICANQNQTTESPAGGTVTQPVTPTCPVATIWDGTTCKGTGAGTNYATEDQPPKENGGNFVADNGQHGGEISRQEGNTAGTGSVGGVSGQVATGATGLTDLQRQLQSCLNNNRHSNAVIECVIGDFIYSGTIQELSNIVNSDGDLNTLSVRLKDNVAQLCRSQTSDSKGNITCRINGVDVKTNIEIINTAASQEQGASLVALNLGGGMNQEAEDIQLYNTNNQSLEGLECITPSEIDITGFFFCSTLTAEQSIWNPITLNLNTNYMEANNSVIECQTFASKRQILSQEVTCVENNDNLKVWGLVTNSTSENSPVVCGSCGNVGAYQGGFICTFGWFNGSQRFNGDANANDICIYPNASDTNQSPRATGDNINAICCDPLEGNTHLNRTGYLRNGTVPYQFKRIWVENPVDTTGFNLFPKASAQILPPVPELVGIDNLTPGKYLISIAGFETAEFTVVNNQVEVKFFNDLNGNGIQDSNEPIINPRDYSTSISKTESIYTINLNLGWNLISLPIANTVIKKASDLTDYIRLSGGDIYQISTYQSGNWVHFVSRINDENKITEFGTDFNIIPGQSYFINSARRSRLTISGNDFLEQPPINLQNGWNLVGFPAQTNQSAIDILQECRNFGTSCSTITKFVDGVYESVIEDLGVYFGNNFQIQKTEGYFILNLGREGVVRW